MFANYIKIDLEKESLLNTSNDTVSEEFYVSSEPEKFKIASKLFYEIKDEPKLLTF